MGFNQQQKQVSPSNFLDKQKSMVERCAVPHGGQIKSKGNSLIKKKERYAVQEGGQISGSGATEKNCFG